MIPKDRIPVHPGEILLKEFLEPMEMTPETAILLSRALGTNAEFWMNLRTPSDHDLAVAGHKMAHA